MNQTINDILSQEAGVPASEDHIPLSGPAQDIFRKQLRDLLFRFRNLATSEQWLESLYPPKENQ